jgi:uncharacterized membrane protein YadS
VVGRIASLAVVVLLAFLANRLTAGSRQVLGRELIEYPIWAVGLGLVANWVLSALRRKGRAFDTELFLKVGLVILGATINVSDVLTYGVRGLAQAVILIACVFLFSWYVGKAFGLEDKLRALVSSSVSICGVSAAIAAAGAVLAKKEHLAYVTTLVVVFALPLMVLQPILCRLLNLPDPVSGAWIGGNIDTTAAVVGAGATMGADVLKVATIAKLSQNALIGLVAFLLALYWSVVVERSPEHRPSAVDVWRRFPKFVLGFVLASAMTTVGVSAGFVHPAQIVTLTALRNWFLTFAFVCIGLNLSVRGFASLGARPVAVYALATGFNMVVALGVAYLLFGGAV